MDSYRKGSFFDIPELDLLESKAISFGGDRDRDPESFWEGTHPRGLRWAFRNWDLDGLQAEVYIDGVINDPSSIDKGWRAEIALPWSSMKLLAGDRSLPPRSGDEWRIFFGRFQKIISSGIEVTPHPAWSACPHGVYDTHLPEKWTKVLFSDQYAP
ncbi:MAG: carbohydrate-binding family 9-like protein [Planctomycetes bacterium]|nr:carbohydrate-binding family 9-like protein [Planctomycetota bacterium]